MTYLCWNVSFPNVKDKDIAPYNLIEVTGEVVTRFCSVHFGMNRETLLHLFASLFKAMVCEGNTCKFKQSKSEPSQMSQQDQPNTI